MTSSLRSLIIVGSLVLLVACQENAVQDIKPKDMTAETLGHYCQMNLLEHSGPKGQVFLEGMPAPLFFSQVRDAIAYMRGPEQMAPILAVYVNDMGAPGATWEKPGDGNWIAIDEALFVVGRTVKVAWARRRLFLSPIVKRPRSLPVPRVAACCR